MPRTAPPYRSSLETLRHTVYIFIAHSHLDTSSNGLLLFNAVYDMAPQYLSGDKASIEEFLSRFDVSVQAA